MFMHKNMNLRILFARCCLTNLVSRYDFFGKVQKMAENL